MCFNEFAQRFDLILKLYVSGRKALHQLEAAYICCNLATGGEYECISVANAAGPYLIGFLDSQNTTLQVAALWTLGNLAGMCHSILQFFLYLHMKCKINVIV